MRGSGIDVDNVGLRQRLVGGAGGNDSNVGGASKVRGGLGGKVGLDFESNDLAIGAHQVSEYGGVVPSAGAYVDDSLAKLRIARGHAARVERRLAVVNAPIRGEADENVLIQQPWVRGDRVHVPRRHAYRPRAFVQESLARHSRKSLNEPLVLGANAPDEKLGEELAVLLDRGHKLLVDLPANDQVHRRPPGWREALPLSRLRATQR